MRAYMTNPCLPLLLGTLALGVSPSAGQANQRPVDFVGVFHPGVPSLTLDRQRCPDPTHPLLFTFQGEAYTTAGHARFEQSHCEAADHTSFSRGLQTISFDDGDQLFGRYSGLLHVTPTTQVDGRLIIDGTYRNTGGTGRFRFAHGSGISAGAVDTMTGIAVISVSGTL